MTDTIISAHHFTAEDLFNLTQQDIEPQNHLALWHEIRTQYPDGITIRLAFDFKPPTIH